MREHYANAAKIAREALDPGAFYPAQNRLIADLVLNIGKPGWRGLDATDVEEIRRELSLQAQSNPDFWAIAGLIELRMYESLASGSLAGEHESVLREFADLRERVPSQRMWASIFDQLTFVMKWAVPHTKAAEREAADTVVRTLRDYAGVAGSSVADSSAPAKRTVSAKPKASASRRKTAKPRKSKGPSPRHGRRR